MVTRDTFSLPVLCSQKSLPTCSFGRTCWIWRRQSEKACKLTTDLGSGPPGHRYVPTAVCSALLGSDRPPRLPVHLSCFSSFEVHLGVSRTISLLRRRFWRDMLEKDISMLQHVPPMPEANIALDERQPQISIKGWTRPVISWGWSWTLRR